MQQMSFHFGFPDVFILKGFVWRPNGSPEVRLETIQLSIFPRAIKMSRLPPSDRDGQNFQVFFPTKWRFDSKCVACLLVGALEWLQTVEPTGGGGGPASEITIVIITGLERKQCFAKNDLLRSPDRKTLSVALVADLTPPLGAFLLLAWLKEIASITYFI